MLQSTINLDNDAVNRVLETIWVVALQDYLIASMQRVAEDNEWTKLPEDEAAEWITEILSGNQKMVVHYLDATDRYVPALRRL